MTLVRAIHAIRRNPEGQVIPTGAFDKEGRPIVRSMALKHAPGELFEIASPTELESLIELNAVEIVTPAEMERIHALRALADNRQPKEQADGE